MNIVQEAKNKLISSGFWDGKSLMVDTRKTHCEQHRVYFRSISGEYERKYQVYISAASILLSYIWLSCQRPTRFKSGRNYVDIDVLKHKVEKFCDHCFGKRPYIHRESVLIAAHLFPYLRVVQRTVGLERPLELSDSFENCSDDLIDAVKEIQATISDDWRQAIDLFCSNNA